MQGIKAPVEYFPIGQAAQAFNTKFHSCPARQRPKVGIAVRIAVGTGVGATEGLGVGDMVGFEVEF